MAANPRSFEGAETTGDREALSRISPFGFLVPKSCGSLNGEESRRCPSPPCRRGKGGWDELTRCFRVTLMRDQNLVLGSASPILSPHPPPRPTKSCFSEMGLLRLFFLLRSLNECKVEIGLFYSCLQMNGIFKVNS